VARRAGGKAGKVSASKQRREIIMEKLFQSGRTYAECDRIYKDAKLLKDRKGRASVRIDGKEYAV